MVRDARRETRGMAMRRMKRIARYSRHEADRKRKGGAEEAHKGLQGGSIKHMTCSIKHIKTWHKNCTIKHVMPSEENTSRRAVAPFGYRPHSYAFLKWPAGVG